MQSSTDGANVPQAQTQEQRRLELPEQAGPYENEARWGSRPWPKPTYRDLPPYVEPAGVCPDCGMTLYRRRFAFNCWEEQGNWGVVDELFHPPTWDLWAHPRAMMGKEAPQYRRVRVRVADNTLVGSSGMGPKAGEYAVVNLDIPPHAGQAVYAEGLYRGGTPARYRRGRFLGVLHRGRGYGGRGYDYLTLDSPMLGQRIVPIRDLRILGPVQMMLTAEEAARWPAEPGTSTEAAVSLVQSPAAEPPAAGAEATT